MTAASTAPGDSDKGRKARTYSLEQLFDTAIALNLPIALWRLPGTAVVQACVSCEREISIGEPALETSPFGYLFCPFQVTETQSNLFLKADIHFSSATGLVTAQEDAPQEALEEFLAVLEKQAGGGQTRWYTHQEESTPSEQTEVNFKGAVAKAVEAIQAEQMEKVVLSRNRTFPLPTAFNLLAANEAMRSSYPQAFVSLISIPGLGTWMGASPEILVSIDRQQIFRTVALAGTQPATENVADAIWRQKEIEEQGMVERYILNCFKKLRLREYTEVGPKTVAAGRLMHLRTDFKVDMKEVDFPRLGTDMLQLLHPTSAVCGLPKAPALDFISSHEGYNRSYYSGYSGPVNSLEGTHLYVNLRCMQLLSDAAVLYAGAGITGESSPEKEWQETEHKMQTMRRILEEF